MKARVRIRVESTDSCNNLRLIDATSDEFGVLEYRMTDGGNMAVCMDYPLRRSLPPTTDAFGDVHELANTLVAIIGRVVGEKNTRVVFAKQLDAAGRPTSLRARLAEAKGEIECAMVGFDQLSRAIADQPPAGLTPEAAEQLSHDLDDMADRCGEILRDMPLEKDVPPDAL